MSKGAFKRMMRERAAPLLRQAPPPGPKAEPEYQPPTDEQLANFAVAMTAGRAEQIGMPMLRDPAMVKLMLRASPLAKQVWLDPHRELQESIGRADAEEPAGA